MLFANRLTLRNRLIIVAVVLLASLALVLLGLDKIVVQQLMVLGFLGAVIAGIFYTFGVTTPFSMIVIVELMHMENPFMVALLACVSAATMDCLLFSVVRDALEASTKRLVQEIHGCSRSYSSACSVAGFFVFGLPLPDELGLAMMEMTEIKIIRLWFIIFFSKLVMLLVLWGALPP